MTGSISTLALVWNGRPGGGGRTERRFLDFVIDGTPLSTLVDADVISPFGWCVADEQLKAVNRLLGEASPDLPGARCSLYVCPECGDLDCGAIGIAIERGKGIVTWRDFAFQRNDVMSHYGFGPFHFDGRAYHQQLESLRKECSESAR